MATLTFAYADSTAVLGPLSPSPEPGAYDLCPRHAERTSVPQGWQVLKLDIDNPDQCLKLFRSNNSVGLIIFLGLVLGSLWVAVKPLV